MTGQSGSKGPPLLRLAYASDRDREVEERLAHIRELLRRLEGDDVFPGAAVLDDIERFLVRFVAYPSEHARVAHVLWISHAHAVNAFDSTPRLAFLSPEPASGKTRGLEVTEPLVPNPVEAVNVSTAYLFRKVGDEDGPPTLLFDEVDTVFGPKAKGDEEIRGLLNAGHRRGAVVGRCSMRGKMVVTEEIPAFCAVALAGLGDLPETILSRSVVVRMRRRASGEAVQPFRRRVHAPFAHELRDRLAEWVATAISNIEGVWPDLPPGIEDRDADVWEPLITMADAAGGNWPARARAAAVAFVADAKQGTPSLGVRLLSDLRAVFGDLDAMATAEILRELHQLPESTWADIRGKPLDDRGLAARLRRYDIRSKVIRIGDSTPRGYVRADLLDTWSRYLPPRPESATSATPATNAALQGE